MAARPRFPSRRPAARPAGVILAGLAAVAGCADDPPPPRLAAVQPAVRPVAAEPVPPAEPAVSPEPAVPKGPFLFDVTDAWAAELDASDAAFDDLAAAVAVPLEDPGDPLVLPDLTDDTVTAETWSAALRNVWRGSAADYADRAGLGDDARTLLAGVARAGSADALTWGELLELADAAAAGPDAGDPVVVANRLWAGGGREGATPERAAAQLAAARALPADAPPLYRHRAPLWALRTARELSAGAAELEPYVRAVGEGTAAFAAAVPALEAAGQPLAGAVAFGFAWDGILTFAPDDPADDRFRRVFLAAMSDGLRAPVERARADLPPAEADAAVGGMLYPLHGLAGDLLIESAWDQRGSRSAGETTEAQFRGFQIHLTAAARHLHAAHLARPHLPGAPAGLVTVAQGGGPTLPGRAWFARAVAARIDYGPAHRNVRGLLQPRWGGSLAAIIRVGNQCLREDLRPANLDREAFYAVWTVRKDVRDGYGPPPAAAWRELVAGCADRLAERLSEETPGDGETPAAARAATLDGLGLDPEGLAGLALACRDLGLTDRYRDVLLASPDRPVGGDKGEPADAEPLGPLRRYLDGYHRHTLAGPLLAADGPAADDAAALAAVIGPAVWEEDDGEPIPAGRLPELWAAADRVRAAAGDDPAQRRWLADVDACLDFLEELYGGGLTTFPLDPGLPGWRCGAAGAAFVEPDDRPAGVLELWGEDRDSLPYLSPLVRLPEPFCLAVELREARTDGSDALPLGIGVGPGAWDPAANPRDDDDDADDTGGRVGGEVVTPTGGLTFLWDRRPRDRAYLGHYVLPRPTRGRSFEMTGPGRMLPPQLDRAKLAVLAEPGRLATFVGGRFAGSTRRVPDVLQPVRLGASAAWGEPFRFQVSYVAAWRPAGFTAPPEFLDVPQEFRPRADAGESAAD